MQLTTRQMEAIFVKLSIAKLTCSHHIRGYVEYEGRKVLPVYYSFGSKDIPKFVALKIAKSMCLSPDELVRMASCKISSEEYFALLRGKGVL